MCIVCIVSIPVFILASVEDERGIWKSAMSSSKWLCVDCTTACTACTVCSVTGYIGSTV